MRRPSLSILATAMLLVFAGCGDKSTLAAGAGVGPAPQLPAPKSSLIPTVDIAPAKGWPEGGKPQAAQGLEVQALARGLDHPRWLYVLPNGDVLVAESNKPQTPETKQSGVRAWVMGKVMAKAGAGVPSADRITLLRDQDGDGVAETRSVFLKNLHSPFGMALMGDQLYVANADAIVRFPYRQGVTEITDAPQTLAPLPAGLNHHWTKNILASRDGSKLYATVGSNSNVGENGLEIEVNRAAILEVDIESGATRLFASGLRNPNGMAWEPQSGALWTVVNERDEIGSDLVPDYLTSVQEGGFYGWPYSYYGRHVDERVQPPRPEMVAKAIVPDYALGAHVAALGLTFAQGAQLGPRFGSGAFIGQHGSWNRKPLSGYNVVYVPFANGKPDGMPVEVLSGFVSAEGDAYGRPVGVAIDKRGALLVADDVGNVVWRVRSVAR
ncbi:MAG: sorbosone dehydrogenase family protein [Pseudomonadota bacterium]